MKQRVNTVLIDHVISIKDEPVVKDAFENVLHIILKANNFSYLNDSLKKI
jgi:hypothetical protein